MKPVVLVSTKPENALGVAAWPAGGTDDVMGIHSAEWLPVDRVAAEVEGRVRSCVLAVTDEDCAAALIVSPGCADLES